MLIKQLRLYTLFILYIATAITAYAQRDEVEQNRPYTDLRPLHFGIVVGTNLQDLELSNVGPQQLTMPDGSVKAANIYCDQHNWDVGFNVGVLAEARLNEYFALRFAPQLYFGTRGLKFINFDQKDEYGATKTETESVKSVYVGADLDLIYAAKRHNNHRPYLMAGIAPMFNLSNKSSKYLHMKGNEVFFEVGLGCDFYLPFFKLRPELKFMLGLSDCLKKNRLNDIKDETILPYAASVNKGTSKLIVLSFYFE